MSRSKRKLYFAETLEQANNYPKPVIYETVKPGQSLKTKSCKSVDFIITVTKNDCIDILVNSASLKNPGGGVRNGSQAQEEELCLQSNLYLALQNINKDMKYPLHEKTNGIYIPDVKFFRNKEFDINIVNLFSRPYDKIKETFNYHVDVFEPLIYFANKYEAEYLVIPPVGCGAFKHDPNLVAKALKHNLDYYQLDTVKEIVISCYTNEDNYDAFDYAF